MVRRRGPRLTLAQKAELWRRWRQGESLNAIGRALGRIPKMDIELRESLRGAA